ncbi:C40 family peptidase [Flavobacterium cerinum]|uniref:NlpC/P60 family protein n=1 Tax=Flavobacterium cerinum TaxID=2502784 RepID=A0ABY5ISR5_9FLAO|nr:C40 family peptidase [Flavobacterium cerinum]UUC45834.1 NlpC/P60 family protein [Flavobacterium cerinum]
MRKVIQVLVLLFLVVSCKTATPTIITSKKEAEKKGVYTYTEKTRSKTVTSSDKNAKTAEVKKSDKKKRKVIDNDVPESDIIVSSENESYMAEQLTNSALDYLGVRYRGGGTTREGMDCSGLVTAVFNSFDMQLPRSSNDMAKVGERLDFKDIKRGDLVFFKTNGKRIINHVGLVVEVVEDEIKFIHSSTSSGVIISSTKEPYYERSFVQANRVVN